MSNTAAQTIVSAPVLCLAVQVCKALGLQLPSLVHGRTDRHPYYRECVIYTIYQLADRVGNPTQSDMATVVFFDPEQQRKVSRIYGRASQNGRVIAFVQRFCREWEPNEEAIAQMEAVS